MENTLDDYSNTGGGKYEIRHFKNKDIFPWRMNSKVTLPMSLEFKVEVYTSNNNGKIGLIDSCGPIILN